MKKACKPLLLILAIFIVACSTTPKPPPVPDNYKGPSGMVKALHRELYGSYFNEEPDSNMEVTVHASQVYAYEYAVLLIDDQIIYAFDVWISKNDDYLRAVRDIMNTIQDGIPQEDWGKLDFGKGYDVRHAQ